MIGTSRPAGWRRLVYDLRTRHSTPTRDAVAIGVGVFLGCSPLFGLHLILSVVAADLLRLNRLKVYLAANISNPIVLPFLLFAEVQTGALVRRGQFQAITLDAIRAIDPWMFGADLIVGAMVVGSVLGLMLGGLTYAAQLARGVDAAFDTLASRAAGPYARASLTAWEFANGKLHGDPVYRLAMNREVLPGGGTLLDIGCGQGLMLALLAEARAGSAGATAAPAAGWPHYDRIVGIETRERVARLAETALAPLGVEIVAADAATTPLPPASAVVLFDVLHMMPDGAQRALLAAIRSTLAPDGVVLVREADAGAGWPFAVVQTVNRVKALTLGPRQTFLFRSRREWIDVFTQAGFVLDPQVPSDPHPLGNLFFRLRSASIAADILPA